MKNLPLLIGTIAGTLLLVIGVAVIFSKPVESKPVDLSILMNNVRHKRGATNPKVTIVEFSDLQCPACRAAQPAVQQVLEKYPNDVQLVFRHFPLVTIHQHAMQAALAAEAAAGQGKFWELHDEFFNTQDSWAEQTDAQFGETVQSFLPKLQIDKTAFQQKIDAAETKDAVATDISDATKLGVNATPTFYVNAVKTPAQDLLKTVQAELQKLQ